MPKQKNDKLTYESAFAEMNRLRADLENGGIPVDEWADTIKRAYELLSFCRKKLRGVEAEIARITENDAAHAESR